MDNMLLKSDTTKMGTRLTQAKRAKTDALWQNTHYANLVRYVPSGRYFARIRIGGKLIRQSLQTRVLGVAKLKLSDLEKEERRKQEAVERLDHGKAKVSDLIREYQAGLEADHTIKPRTREYYNERLAAMIKDWPELPDIEVRRLTEKECERWSSRCARISSPTNFNNSLTVLRKILQIGVSQGIRYKNPAAGLKRARVRRKELTLPSQSKFPELVAEIRKVPFGPGLASADLVEFLAYGGFRKGEASFITWADCDFVKHEILVRGNPETGTKNGDMRRVPMIPDMLKLLERLRNQRPKEQRHEKVMRVHECQGALTRACKAIGIARITHHDLRHLFATRRIESGVDIPTVSRWLGHRDGGALAMKVYGHLRDQHSLKMAQRVSFAAPGT